MGVDRFKGELVRQRRMHWDEDLAGCDGVGDGSLHDDASLGGSDANFSSRSYPELRGVDRIDFHVRLSGRELFQDRRFSRSRKGVPLSGTATASQENEWVVALVGRRARFAED